MAQPRQAAPQPAEEPCRPVPHDVQPHVDGRQEQQADKGREQQAADDGERFVALGLPRERLHLTGSIKFDITLAPELVEQAAALDASLMQGLPPHITAATGMDALTHAIEAYIGVWERGSRLEDGRIAVKLVFEHLVNAYENGGDAQAREGMAVAAYYGGMAINQVNVGSVHAIAHQIGGKYGIPHGLANALILPHVLEFCREEAQARLAELAVVIGAGEESEPESQLAHKFIAAVRELRTNVGIPDRSELIRREDHQALAAAAIEECMAYPVPRLLDEAGTLDILNQITE